MMDLKGYLAKNLSYGQKRILEIAIAMACEPKLLMLDEPVAGLNPMESQNVMQMISKIRSQGVTILLVEHDMNLVMDIAGVFATLIILSAVGIAFHLIIQAIERKLIFWSPKHIETIGV